MAGFKLTKSLMRVLFPKKKKSTGSNNDQKKNTQPYDELFHGSEAPLKPINETDEHMLHLLHGTPCDSTPGSISSSFSFSDSASMQPDAMDKCIGGSEEGGASTASIKCGSFEIDEATKKKECIGTSAIDCPSNSCSDGKLEGKGGVATQTEPKKAASEERKYIGVARMRRRMIREQRMREKAANGENETHAANGNFRTTRVVDQARSYESIVFYENSPPPPSNPSSPERSHEQDEEISEMKDENDRVSEISAELGKIDLDGFPVAQDDTQRKQLQPQKNEYTQFFILLLCPKSRIFELIEITDSPKTSTISDILHRIPEKCTDDRLLEKNYIGFCRPSDRTEFMNPTAPAFQSGEEDDDWIATDSIREDDVLVAILRGSTGYEMSKISKPILRNSKFKDMIRRRRRSNYHRTKNRRGSTYTAGSESDYDNMSFSGDITVRSSKSKESNCGQSFESKNRHTSICKKLEDLSKKLRSMDGDFSLDDDSRKNALLTLTAEQSTADVEEQATSPPNTYKMSPKMVTNELANNIRDIFVDHDVEILAVDGEDSDDDTFVSARSSRSMRSVASKRSMVLGVDAKQPLLGDKPLFEITTKKKRKPKEKKFDDSYENNALALQIETMAAEAESAFQRRHAKEASKKADKKNIENMIVVSDVAEKEPSAIPSVTSRHKSLETREGNDKVEDSIADIDMEVDASFDASDSTTAFIDNKIDEFNSSSNSALSRTFINTSTSMVSSLVAASQGRVNEIHVLQYLGATIVCIAANIMQQNRQTKTSAHPFGASEVFQSAMFLAFMHNGQRYMARVTTKNKSALFK
mmetsp:Transcript_2407/g.5207  ORF Transcript_2407/g.5207 Transcript_2407/m.5207 type:complete len:813 (-) Transcript_2407:126-2564(-)